MTAFKLISWEPFFNALKESGLLPHPERTYRVVIDAKVGKPCRIYYEMFGDERLLAAIGPDAFIPADDKPNDSIVK